MNNQNIEHVTNNETDTTVMPQKYTCHGKIGSIRRVGCVLPLKNLSLVRHTNH
jgi:hypothetical protein